jgi:hypothetical protein
MEVFLGGALMIAWVIVLSLGDGEKPNGCSVPH